MPVSKLAFSPLATPVIGLLASAGTLGEALTPTNIAGLALVSGGVALVTAEDSLGRLAIRNRSSIRRKGPYQPGER